MSLISFHASDQYTNNRVYFIPQQSEIKILKQCYLCKHLKYDTVRDKFVKRCILALYYKNEDVDERN